MTHRWQGQTAAERKRISDHEFSECVAYMITLVTVLVWWPFGLLAKGWPVVLLLIGNAALSIARGVANFDDEDDQ